MKKLGCTLCNLVFSSFSSHLTPHSTHLTPLTSHPTPHTSHLTPHTSHRTPYNSSQPGPRKRLQPAWKRRRDSVVLFQSSGCFFRRGEGLGIQLQCRISFHTQTAHCSLLSQWHRLLQQNSGCPGCIFLAILVRPGMFFRWLVRCS